MRPLGLPTFTDKLVQEVMRMILEAVYEPIFLPCSHGFRPKRSCHTALVEIKKSFTGVKWFIEGDIKGCFDNIDHHILVGLVNRKIKDAKFIQLLWKFLKAGYLEDWQYHATHSGTPQGGIISPILANIYLHELDKYAISLKRDFDVASKSKYTPEYYKVQWQVRAARNAISKANEEERPQLLKELKRARQAMLATPAKLQTDKKFVYIRYADDFIIGINGSREDCEALKGKLASFVRDELKMELSEEKTLITHSSKQARFLGYDICVRRNATAKPNGQGYTQRTLNNKVELCVPLQDKIERFLFSNDIVKQKNGALAPVCRKKLLKLSDLEIVIAVNSELRGLCNYYCLASNFNSLDYFAYLMEYSCLKTLAGKHKTTTAKIIKANQDGRGKWGIAYNTKGGKKRLYFAKFRDCKENSVCEDVIRNRALEFSYTKSSLERKLDAQVCEMCGRTDVKLVFHHVNKVKNLKGKALWEQLMIAKRRKTLAVCPDCHKQIHNS
jgi:group II intron reverse transcriptase/maturase